MSFNQTERMQDQCRNYKTGYAMAVNNINFATANLEADYVLFLNPGGSTKLVEIYEQIVSMPLASNNTSSEIRIYKNPTVTVNGTPIATGGLRNGQPAAQALGFTLPTVTARGTLVQVYGLNYSPIFRPLNLHRFVEIGDSILFTVTPGQANTQFTMTQAWIETNPNDNT